MPIRRSATDVHLLGLVSDADKPGLFRTADVYVAPNTGQESFGIVLLEAMAAGTPVVASDIDAFRRVLDDGRAGRLFAQRGSRRSRPGADRGAAARDQLRGELAERRLEGGPAVRLVDRATEIVQVYETVTQDLPYRR